MVKDTIECVGCDSTIDVGTLTNRLVLKDKIAIIPGLEDILTEVMKMRLDTRAKIGDELMRRVKSAFEVPEDEEKDYRASLMDEYDRRMIDFT